ncbi:gluconokinase [Pelagibacterium xiamenense]|uniref:gluconokinase n=1 Tax=Pelagibacterium xiamenense TaxID=2901140 RepID=UPI001E555C0D|nr:gluconokinase [Pelagibacterium xiamenense]MCD7060209.1 gluconokinase [Pelagibacterium xiamenense]
MRVTGHDSTGRPAHFFVFMGVCGVGKSTMAKAFADALGGVFIEADALHPRENVEAMAAGRPLTDAERWPWLKAVCDHALAQASDRPAAIACSALRKPYRDFLRGNLADVAFFHLHGPEDVIRDRMARRKDHFMPLALLESQLSVLELPTDEPDCHGLDIRQAPDRLLAQAVATARRESGCAEAGGTGNTLNI